MDNGSSAFEVKGTVSSLTVLRLRTADLGAIEADLAERIRPFPHIFASAPVVIDAAFLEGKPLAWEAMARILRASKLVPVAAANVPLGETDPAVSAGFGIVQLGSRMRSVRGTEAAAAATDTDADADADADTDTDTATATVTATVPAAGSGPLLAVASSPPITLEPLCVSQPVRGGQVVYARGVDLVARAPVNAGAQVIADGSIQIWAPLRGRALAGAQGRKDARIFCLSLEAELVSVAGEYVLADEIPDALRGRPAQVFLDGDRVRIAPL